MKLKLAMLTALLGVAVAMYFLFTGPRMKVQENIRAFQAVMPPPPPGAVPYSLSPASAPAPRDLAAGRTYYSYYCLMCHGESGDGRGPVGESYVPFPSDLRAEKFRGYSDALLMEAMLSGTGHAPVLERVVLEQHRPALLLYVRSFCTGGSSRPAVP